MTNLSPQKKSILIALLLSVLFVHVPLFVVVWKMTGETGGIKFADNKKNRAVMVDLKRPVPLPVVDAAEPSRQEIPDKPSAQALHNSKVKEETTASRFAKINTPVGQRLSVVRPEKPMPQKTVDQTRRSVVKEHAAEQPAAPSQNLSFQDELKALQGMQKNKEQRNLAKFESKAADVMPLTNLGTPNGGSTDDYLPHYKVGNRTFVNALANPRVAYYVELKRKFKFTWNPVPTLRRQFNKISKGKIEVVWGVSVDAEGRLKDLLLIRGSGVSSYDAEARRTIMASAPFSRPPGYLLKQDGQLHMAWTFAVYL